MATTIRVYLDGGGTAYASAAMNADRTFSVSLASVPAGTHTFEVTAQEDGKGESARVIQTVEVNRGAQQTHPLLADISASAAVLADLTAPGPATQHALAATISAAATVAADLTVIANTSLEASISASATTVSDLTAPGQAGAFSDDFTGTNGSAPNATKWPATLLSVSADPGASTATIQGNTLALAAAGIDEGEGPYLNQSISKRSAWISGVAHTTTLDVTSYGGGRCYASWLGDNYAADLNGAATRNYLDVFLTSDTTYEVWHYNGSGTGTMVGSGSVAAGGPYAISLTVPASGDVSLTIKGNVVALTLASLPLTTAGLGWGSQFKFQMTQLTVSGYLTESRFDNVNVT